MTNSTPNRQINSIFDDARNLIAQVRSVVGAKSSPGFFGDHNKLAIGEAANQILQQDFLQLSQQLSAPSTSAPPSA